MTRASLGASDDEWLRDFGIIASRRFTVWTLIVSVAAVHVPPAIDLANTDHSTTVTAAGIAGLVITFAIAQALLRVELRGLRVGMPATYAIPAVAGIVVAVGLLAMMAPDASEAWPWSLPLATLLGATAAALARPRRDALVAVGVVVAAVIVLAERGSGSAIGTAIACAVVACARLLSVWGWEVTLQLARARHAAADLAVAEERVRFASDLHDVQGHHLQVILLKAQLVERLVGRDDEAARGEATQIRELATQALQDTRAVVHGYRRTTLATELSNAAQILDAAGTSTTVSGDAERVPATTQELLGRLVREGTTNVLRHSRASRCTIDVRVTGDTVTVTISNDGAAESPTETGSGLAGLRDGFRAAGGDLTADHRPPDTSVVEATVHSGRSL